MKNSMKLLLFLALFTTSLCWGWNCPSGQIRQQAPAGTSTSAPYYDVVEGIAFICVPTPTTPTSTGVNTLSNNLSNVNTAVNTNTNSANSAANSASNSASNSSANQTQQQQQKQGQSQVATGGNATSSAQGGTAVATGNGNNSNDSVTNIAAPKIPVSSAITPPIMPTVPCFKGMGGSVQTMAFGGSFGGGKVDQGCDDRELARSFSGPQTIASCKILLNTKKAKKAGITLEECLGPKLEAAALVLPEVTPAPVLAPVPVLLQPAVTIINQLPSPPEYRTEVTVTPPPAPKRAKRVHHMTPACQNGMEMKCVTKAQQGEK